MTPSLVRQVTLSFGTRSTSVVGGKRFRIWLKLNEIYRRRRSKFAEAVEEQAGLVQALGGVD